MENNPFKEFNDSEIGKSMLKAWKNFVQENEGCFAEDSIETADFFAGFQSAWEEKEGIIKSLEERIILAEQCMRNTWELSIIPNGDMIVKPLKDYRSKYSEALKRSL
jgi:hypothetical protein